MKGIGMEEAVPDRPNDRTALSAGSTPEATPEHPIPVTAAVAKSLYHSASFSGTSPCSSPLARLLEARHVRSNSFQRWRRRIQRAWRWGPGGGSHNGNDGNKSSSSGEQGFRTTWNWEAMANQKRQWYQIQSKSRDLRQYKEPSSLFEHFFIVGLHPFANVEAIEDAFAKKILESEMANSAILDVRKVQYHGCMPTLEPQILFKYPPGNRVAIREDDLPAFCFPEGVKARLIMRTPSMSDLNEVVFGKEHLSRDDLFFIFCLKVSDNTTLYGVCLRVQEIVQRAPSILSAVSPINHSSCKPSRFLVAAPRCYCILTRVPFFELHYQMLNSVIAQEHLERIKQSVSEMILSDPIPHGVAEHDQQDENFCTPHRQPYNDWMQYAVPVDTISGLLSSSGLSSDGEVPPFLFRTFEPQSPEGVSASNASDFSHLRELAKETWRPWQQYDDYTSETSDLCSDSFERVNGNFEIGQTSPEVGTVHCSVRDQLERVDSVGYLYSSPRGARSDDEDDDFCFKHEMNIFDEKVMEWAKTHNNEPLMIVCGYRALPLPPRGDEIIFHPRQHLQPIKYCRPGVMSLSLDHTSPDIDPSCLGEANEVNAQLAAAEEALALSIWTIAAVCRSLSLESVLALFAGALLEKQVVVICPNLGVLSAIVLSVIPMIQPFEWQSLLLPVLPQKMLDILDAPVPFIVGIQHKPADNKIKTANVIQVNVSKDQVKTCSLPQLPRYKELFSDLSPIHAQLSLENYIAERQPIYRCSEVQAEAAGHFLRAMRGYLESFCSNLRSHTITYVQSNNDKVSLLLKDSFVDSFPIKDRPFIRLFIDTQLFSVLSDSRLSTHEHESS